MPTSKKKPDPIDIYVGSRIRMRRMMLSMSQEKLGDGLKLTFQQVQKYEKGTNRVGSSRLRQIATILQVPESFFFEGAPAVPGSTNQVTPAADYVTEFMSTRYGLTMTKAFMKLTPKLRVHVADFVEALAQA